ncbi:hypothetical protein Tco_1145299 [Tanacetum coccineum]
MTLDNVTFYIDLHIDGESMEMADVAPEHKDEDGGSEDLHVHLLHHIGLRGIAHSINRGIDEGARATGEAHPLQKSNAKVLAKALRHNSITWVPVFGRFFSGKNLEMPAVQANFFRKKSGNAAVQTVYKKKLQTFPQRHVAGENPAKGQNSGGKAVEKFKLKGNLIPLRHVAGENVQLT